MNGFIIIKEFKNPVEVIIISNKYTTLQVQHEENEANTIGKCLVEALAFFPDDGKINVVTNNVFVTNTITYWSEEIKQKYPYWKDLFEQINKRNIEVFAYTKYDF
jgi:hypothetical protein